jgi:general secretion pathway protein F
MAKRLDAGATLEEALAAQGPRFPRHVRQLVLAGVQSGQLAEVLEEFVDIKREHLEVRRRVWLALGYPIALLSLLSLVFVLLHYLVVEEFRTIYMDFELMLPSTTLLVLAIWEPLTLTMAGGTAALILVVVLLAALPKSVFLSQFLHRFPVLGPVWRFSRLSQCCRMIAIFLGQKVALPRALQLTAVGVEEPDLARVCRELAAEVEQGRPLVEGLAARRQFPPSMIPLIDWGQQNSVPAEAFRASADMFRTRARTQSTRLQTLALPLVYLWIVMLMIMYLAAFLRPLLFLSSSM